MNDNTTTAYIASLKARLAEAQGQLHTSQQEGFLHKGTIARLEIELAASKNMVLEKDNPMSAQELEQMMKDGLEIMHNKMHNEMEIHFSDRLDKAHTHAVELMEKVSKEAKKVMKQLETCGVEQLKEVTMQARKCVSQVANCSLKQNGKVTQDLMQTLQNAGGRFLKEARKAEEAMKQALNVSDVADSMKF
ncbi:MAG: hypothetical protein SGARI_003088 [Bacillariaceae sp.]